MNHLLSESLLTTKKDLLDSILAIENPHHEKKLDAQLKWLGVADAYETLGLNVDTLVDVGCGPSSLPLHFKKTVPNVYGIDYHLEQNAADFLMSKGMNFIRADVLETECFEPASIDCIVDACAIGCSMNLEKALIKIEKWLKPGGYLISVGDSDLTQTSHPFASPQTWVDTAKSLGLELVGDFPSSNPDDAYFYGYNKYKLYISRLVFRKPVV